LRDQRITLIIRKLLLSAHRRRSDSRSKRKQPDGQYVLLVMGRYIEVSIYRFDINISYRIYPI